MIVCEAFAGNIVLKLYEGVASTLLAKVKEGLMSSLRSKIGALLIKPALKQTLKSFDASQYGGAPLFRLQGAGGKNTRQRHSRRCEEFHPAVRNLQTAGDQ